MLLTQIKTVMPAFLLHRLSLSDILILLQQKDIVIVLSITVTVFLILLILGIRKTHKLNEENQRLADLNPLDSTEDDSYKDFTEGHLYSND